MPDIRSLFEKDYLGKWDVADKDLTLTIKGVEKKGVLDPATFENKEKVCLSFVETSKLLVLNATNRDIIAKDTHKAKRERTYDGLGLGYDYEKWIGKKVTFYFEPSVKNNIDKTDPGGIRIRGKAGAPAEETILCEECGKPITAAFGMTAAVFATYSKDKIGKRLCKECAGKVGKNA